MKLVLLSRDLMLTSQVDGAARHKGYQAIHTADLASAVAAAEDPQCHLLLVDLQLPGLDISSLVTQVREGSPGKIRIVACGPHVHENRLAAASEAGCDQVLTRGQFHREVDASLEMSKPE